MEHTHITRYPAYKDSGVEWLGEIPKHWEINRLRTIANIVNGSTPSSNVESYWDGNTVWVTPAEINNVVYLNDSVRKISDLGYRSCGTTLVPKGSIVLTTRAPIGKVALAGKALCTNQGCKSLVLRKGQGEYLYFQLLVRGEELNSLGKGTTFMELGNTELKDFLVIFPPLPEQTRIAEFLERKTALIDRAVAQKERLIALLRERRQILIHTAVTRGLNPDVPLKDSGVAWIGQIPAHWEVVSVRRIIDVRDGTHDTPVYIEDGEDAVPLVTSKDFKGERINFEDIKKISSKDHVNISKRSGVATGDVLMSMIGGNIGKSVIVGDFDDFSIKNVALFRTRANRFLAKYLKYYFQSGLLQKQIELKSRGGAQGFLSLGDIRNLIFFKLPSNELNQIVDYLDNTATTKIETAITNQQAQIEKLQEYKATLINSAVTGKMRV